MTDLSQFLRAPLEASSDSSAYNTNQAIPTPNYAKFSKWAEENATGDDATDYKGYSDFVRQHHFKEDTWNAAVEVDLRQNYQSALASKGLLDPQDKEQVRSLYAPKDISLESRLQTITSTYGSDTEQWQKATAFFANEKAIAKYGEVDDPAYIEQRNQLRAEAEEVAYSEDWDKSVIESVNTGNVIAARVKDSTGESVIRLGKQAKGMSTKEIIESSKHLGISYDDALEIEASNSAINLKGTTYSEQRRFADLADTLNVLLTDEDVGGTTLGTMQVDREGRMLSGLIHSNVDEQGAFFGPDQNTIEATPHNRAKKNWAATIQALATYDESLASGDQKEINRAKKVYDSNVENLGYILEETGLVSSKGESVDFDDLKKVVEQAAAGAATEQNLWAFQDEPDKLKYNLKDYGYQDAVMHGAAVPRKQMFDAIIEANPQLSEEQVTNLQNQRKLTLENNFDTYNQILSNGNAQDEWQEAVQVGLAEGKSNGTILEEFVENDDNYSELTSRIGGIGMSIPNALGSALAAIPAMMGNEYAQGYLQDQIKDNQARRATARLFGVEMGMGQDIAEMVAPVVTDVAITGALAFFTGGVGGAGYLAAKTGANLTLKNVAKGVVTNAFKVTGKESAEKTLNRLIKDGFVTTTGASGRKGAMEAIENFSKFQASKLNTVPAMALPAFNRSAGMTYASTYAALESSGLSHEEKHDRALGAGLVGGAFTALLTGSFGALGAGGAEKTFLSGMSKKQAVGVISRLSERGRQVAATGNPDKLLAGVLKDATRKSVYGNSKYGLKDTVLGEILSDAAGESAEEFIDEFVNGIVTDFYTDKDTPLLERISGAGWAALAGGIFGGGLPAGRRTIQNITGATSAMARVEEQAVQQGFIKDVTDRLNESGAPVSAQLVEQILTVPMGEVDAARAAYDRYTQTRGGDGDAGPTEQETPPAPSGPSGTPPSPEEEAAPEAEPTPVEIPQGEREFDQSIPANPTTVNELVEGDFVQLPNGNLAQVVAIKQDVKARGKTYARVVGLSNGVVIPSETGSDTLNTIVFPDAAPTAQADTVVEGEEETMAPPALEIVPPSVEKSEPFIRKRVAELIRQNGVVDASFVASDIAAITGDEISAPEAAATITENYVINDDGNIVGVIDPENNEQIGVDRETQDIFTIIRELEERTPEDWEAANRQVMEEEQFKKESIKAPVQLEMDLSEEEANSLTGDFDTTRSTVSPAFLDVLSPPPTRTEVINLEAAGINPEEVNEARAADAYEQQLDEDITEAPLNETEDEVMELSKELEELIGLGDPKNNAPKIQSVIDAGYPVRISTKQNYGVVSIEGRPPKYYSRISDYIATRIYENSPWIEVSEPVGGETITTKATKAKTWFNPKTQKSIRTVQRAYVDEDGRGVFDNNPLTMALLEEAEIPFMVPEDMDPADVNKAFVVDWKEGRRVTQIRKPEQQEGLVMTSHHKKARARDTVEDNTTFEKYMVAAFMFDDVQVGNLPITVDSIPTGATTSRDLNEGETVTAAEVADATDMYVTASLDDASEGSFFRLMSPRGEPLDPIYLTAGSLSVQAETKYFAYVRAVRQELLREGSRNNVRSAVQQNADGVYEIQPENELAARTRLLQAFMEFTNTPKTNAGQKKLAKQVSPLMSVDRVSANSLENVSNYVLDEILNNKVTKDAMPTVGTIAKKVATRMAGQQRYTKSKNYQDTIQTVELDVSREDGGGAINVEAEQVARFQRANINDLAPDRKDAYMAYDEAAAALENLDQKKEARTLLEDLVFGSVMRDTPTNRKQVRKTSSPELMRLVQAWLDEGRQNQKVKDFKDRLQSMQNEDSTQQDPEMLRLQNALKILNINTASVDGNMSQDSGYTQTFQKNIKNGADASAFAKTNTSTRASRMARSRVSQAGQAMANELNTAEAKRLGLVAGDPESVLTALRNIAANKLNKQHSLVAELLLENPSLIKSIEFNMTELNLGKYAGLFTQHTDGSLSVTLNMNGHNGKGLTNVLLEEYLHATLWNTVSQPQENLTQSQQEARSRLENLMGEIREAARENGYAPNSPIMDSLGNIDEFIAGIMLSSELQQEILALGKAKNAKKSFFKRIGDAILRFFGKGVTSAEAAEYSNAIVDVITVKSGAGVEASAKTAAKRIAQAAMVQMDRNNMMLRAIGVENMVGYEARQQATRQSDKPLTSREQQILNSSLEENASNNAAEVEALVGDLGDLDVPDDMLDLSEAQQKMRALLQHMRDLIPPEVNLALDPTIEIQKQIDATQEQLSKIGIESDEKANLLEELKNLTELLAKQTPPTGPAKMQGGMIYLNPEVIFQLTKDMDIVSSRLLMSAVVEEELAHVASYNALTQSEIDKLASTLSKDDFERIIDNYFTTNKAKRDDTKALLAAEVTEEMTPEEKATLQQEILNTKRMLVEEHLRSVGQRVTRGYTTEEDHAFYKTNPSMRKILFRYVMGVFKRMSASHSVGSIENVYMASAVNRLVDELRAIKQGYRMAPTHLNFDPNNPDNSYVTLAAILNDKMVSDPEDFLAELKAAQALNTSIGGIPRAEVQFVMDLTTGKADYPEQEDRVTDAPSFPDLRTELRTTLKKRQERVLEARWKMRDQARKETLNNLPSGTDAVPDDFYEVALTTLDEMVEESVLENVTTSPLTVAENLINLTDADQQSETLQRYLENVAPEIIDPATQGLLTERNGMADFDSGLESELMLDFGDSPALSRALQNVKQLYFSALINAQQDQALTQQDLDTDMVVRLKERVIGVQGEQPLVATTDVVRLRTALRELESGGYMEIVTDELSNPVTPTMMMVVGKLGSRSMMDFSIEADGSLSVGSMAPFTLEDEQYHISDRYSKGEISQAEADAQSAQIEQLMNEGGRVAATPNTIPLLVKLLAANGEIKAPAIITQGSGSGQIVNMSMSRRAVLINALKKADGIDPSKKAKMIQDLQNSGAMTKGYDAWAKYGFENTSTDLKEFRGRLEGQLPVHIHNNFAEWLATSAPEEYANAMVDVKDMEKYDIMDVVITQKGGGYSFRLLGDVNTVHSNADADVVAHIEANFKRIQDYHTSRLKKLEKIATSSRKTWSMNKIVKHKEGLGLWKNYGWDQQFRFDLNVGSPAMEQFGQKGAPILGRALNSSLEAGGSIDSDSVNMSGFLKTLEMPVYKTGDYNAPRRWYNRLFQGEVDPRITDLHKNRLAFLRASDLIVTKYKRKMDKLVKKAFGDTPSDTQKLMLERAMGDAKGIVVESEVLTAIDEVHEAELAAIAANEDLTSEQSKAAIEASKLRKKEAVASEEMIARDEILRTKDQAMGELETISPDLAQHIRDIRKELIQPLSTYIKDNFGLNEDLQARMDMNMDFYITRSYRMFTDADYARKVETDPAYHEVRQAAIKYFEKQYVKDQTALLVKNKNLSKSEANAQAEAKLRAANDSGHPKGQQLLDEFLESYKPNSMSALAKNHAESYRVVLDNLKKKKDLDISLRNLLGEYGQDGTVDNLLRTFSTVAKMSANQAFINNVAEMGKAEGFLMPYDEWVIAREEDPDTYAGWRPLRNTNQSSDGDPLAGYYAPAELKEGFDKTFDRTELRGLQTKTEEVIGSFGRFARAVTGLSMASKTLGSVGFFVRNAASNMFFFGPAQGYYSAVKDVPLIMIQRAGAKAKSTVLGEQIEEAMIEYTSLGIIGDEVRGQMMMDLMRGKTTPDILMEEQVGPLSKLKKGGKPVKYAYEKAAELASAIDAFYKIGYFEKELRVLVAASKEVGSNIPTDEYQLKRLAAKKVKMTAQSHSEAPPFITGLSQSNFGMLFAPFIRFKAEVPRIVMNTYKLSFEEIRSGNAVLRRRGYSRFLSMTNMLGVVSAAVPTVLQAMAGIGEEEDAAMRAGIPSYLRGHTFFYFRDEDTGNLVSLDFTYLNPFSLGADPALRMMEDVRRGKFASGAGKLVTGFLTDQYLDPQILASSLMDISENRNAANDNPIVESRTDDGITKMTKRMAYVLKEAYGPDLYKRFKKLYDTKDIDPTLLRKEDMPLQILIDQFKPFKPHTVDVDKQYRRYLYELKDEYDRVSSGKYKAYSARPQSDDALGQLYHDEVAKRKIIQNDLVRITRGYVGLGMTEKGAYEIMTSSGVSKRRAKNTFSGVMDKPVIGPKFFNKLYAKSQGPNATMTEDDALRRAGAIYRAMATYPFKHIELDERF